MNIYQAIPKIASEVGAIGKDRKNTQQNYNFRGIDDVYNALNASLAKHGVFSVPEVMEHAREERPSKSGGVLISTILKMQYTFFADDGSNVRVVVMGEGMDSGDKSANKAMAVAHKYALLQIFAIPTEDAKDPEHDSPEPAPLANLPKEEIKTIIDEAFPPDQQKREAFMQEIENDINDAPDVDELTVLFGKAGIAMTNGVITSVDADKIKKLCTKRKNQLSKEAK